jgi:hypothetical protein
MLQLALPSSCQRPLTFPARSQRNLLWLIVCLTSSLSSCCLADLRCSCRTAHTRGPSWPSEGAALHCLDLPPSACLPTRALLPHHHHHHLPLLLLLHPPCTGLHPRRRSSGLGAPWISCVGPWAGGGGEGRPSEPGAAASSEPPALDLTPPLASIDRAGAFRGGPGARRAAGPSLLLGRRCGDPQEVSLPADTVHRCSRARMGGCRGQDQQQNPRSLLLTPRSHACSREEQVRAAEGLSHLHGLLQVVR